MEYSPMNSKRNRFLVSFLLIFMSFGVFLSFWYDPVGPMRLPPPLEVKAVAEGKDDGPQRASPVTVKKSLARKGPTGWKQLTIFQIHDKFRAKLSPNCGNKKLRKRCLSTMLDEDCRVDAMDYIELNEFVKKNSRFVPLLDDKEYVFPWEKNYVIQKPLSNEKKLPDLEQSKITVLSHREENGLVTCRQHEELVLRADIYDSYGKTRSLGGDDVRAWMTKATTPNITSATLHVVDWKNGTYTLSTPCLWLGQSQLIVVVPYPREYLRMTLVQRRNGRTRYKAGLFQKNNITESTICWSTPNLFHPCLCNYTTQNTLPFYCGQPADPRLTCDDWAGVNSLWSVQPANLTSAENRMIQTIVRKPEEVAIKHPLTIRTTKSSKAGPKKLLPCWKTSPRVTWETKRPQGYWTQQMEWRSLLCKQPEFTPQWLDSCLKDTTVLITGDSNSYAMYSALKSMPRCSRYANLSRSGVGGVVCKQKSRTGGIKFAAHEHPLYMKRRSANPWISVMFHKSVEMKIDELPSTGRVVVIVHYYLHLITAHLSSSLPWMNSLRDAVQRLVRRNPQATVALRGGHMAWDGWHVNHHAGGDVLATFLHAIIREVFTPVRDNLIYVDAWGMTVSLQNRLLHPHPKVQASIVKMVLSFACP
ncbi:NXPE family member 3 [Aplysia californica]|uniref:NXPE family member 3 n=1 Tax=Aplysia californica TaxID=6500 RepID=A0ABM1A1D9_APLCA|nr:NXPE family member 3 [Aplysia californica]